MPDSGSSDAGGTDAVGSDSGGMDASGTDAGARDAGGDGDASMADSFQITLVQPSVRLARGATAAVDVTVAPAGGFNGAVTVTVSGLPPGVSAAALTIPAGSTTGTLQLTATASAQVGGPVSASVDAASGTLASVAPLGVTVADVPGAADVTFGANGIVDFSIPNYDVRLEDVTVQPDGKIVVAGEVNPTGTTNQYSLLVLRFLPDGQLDRSFGTNGRTGTTVDVSPYYDVAVGVRLQPDGKIVVGTTNNRAQGSVMGVFRYNADGTPDFGFGNAGSTLFAGSSGTGGYQTNAMTVEADGSILLAGQQTQFSANRLLVHFTPDGALDTAYGSGAVASLGNGITVYAVTTLADGTALVAGTDFVNATLMRVTAAGLLDTSFANTGVSGGNPQGRWHSVSSTPGGRILAGGATGPMPGAVGRYNANGFIDGSFGTAGVARYSLPADLTAFTGHNLLEDARGGLVVAGEGTQSTGPLVGLVRFDAGGAQDTSFGVSGIARPAPGYFTAAAPYPDGDRIVVVHVRGTTQSILRAWL